MRHKVFRYSMIIVAILVYMLGYIYSFIKGDGYKILTYTPTDLVVEKIGEVKRVSRYATSYPESIKYGAEVTYINPKDNTEITIPELVDQQYVSSIGYNTKIKLNSNTKDYITYGYMYNYFIWLFVNTVSMLMLVVYFIKTGGNRHEKDVVNPA